MKLTTGIALFLVAALLAVGLCGCMGSDRATASDLPVGTANQSAHAPLPATAAPIETPVETLTGAPATAFYVSTLEKRYGVWNLSSDDYTKQYACLYGAVRITLDAIDSHDKVKTLVVGNFSVVKQPTAGKPLFMVAEASNLVKASARDALVLTEKLVVPVVDKTPEDWASWMSYYANLDGNGQIVIKYGLFDLGELTDSGADAAYTYLVHDYTNDSLRSTIAFDITLTTDSGMVYTRHIEADMIEGAYINSNMQVTTATLDYQDKPEEMPLTLVQ